MPVQGATYGQVHSAGAEGAMVDGQLRNVRSGVAQVAIPFGLGVVKGTGDNDVKLPTTIGEAQSLIGVSVREQDDAANSSDVLRYEAGRNMAYCDFGVIYVKVENAVTARAAAFCRFTAGAGGTQPGAFRSNADTNTAGAPFSAIFLASGAAGSIVPLRFWLG